MQETTIQKQIIKYLNSLNAYVIKTIVTNRSGVPDIICCYGGKFLAFEVKSETGKLSELQKYNFKLIEQSKGLVFEVRSVEEVKQVIEHYFIGSHLSADQLCDRISA